MSIVRPISLENFKYLDSCGIFYLILENMVKNLKKTKSFHSEILDHKSGNLGDVTLTVNVSLRWFRVAGTTVICVAKSVIKMWVIYNACNVMQLQPKNSK